MKLSRIFLIFFLSFIILGCAGRRAAALQETPAPRDAITQQEIPAASGDLEGSEWKLSEIRSGGTSIVLNRQRLEAQGFSGVFTIHFEDGRISGMGAPNRFFGPYTKGENQALSIGMLGSTMMAAFMEPEELTEHEYFSLLSDVSRWTVRDGKLELFTKNSGGAEVVLVFRM